MKNIFIQILCISLCMKYVQAYYFNLNISDEQETCLYKTNNMVTKNYLMVVYTTNNLQKLNYILQQGIIHAIIIYKDFIFVQELSIFKVSIYLLDTPNELEDIMVFFTDIFSWNPRMKHIIEFSSNVNLTEVFQIAWNYYVYNIIVIQNNNVFTYFPYRNNSCGDITPVHLTTCENITSSILFQNKIPSTVNGCQITFGHFISIPMIFNTTSDKDDVTIQGLELQMFKTIFKKLNFTIKSKIHTVLGQWGVRLSNKSFTHMYGQLQRKEIDIVFGLVYFANLMHFSSFDIIYSHIETYQTWWVPTALEISKWKNIVLVFTSSLWYLIFAACLLTGILWFLIGKIIKDTKIFDNFVLCVLNSWYVLLQNSLGYPRSNILRILFVLWSIASVLLTTAYNCKLISFLTSPLYDHQISTVSEVAGTSLQMAMYPGSILSFNTSFEADKIVIDRFLGCDNIFICVDRMIEKRDIAVLIGRRTMNYFMPRKWTAKDGKKLVFEIEDASLTSYFSSVTRKGFPYKQKLELFIIQLRENGFIKKWDTDLKTFHRKEIATPLIIKLNLEHLQSGFYILICGLLLSISLFVMELIVKHYKIKN